MDQADLEHDDPNSTGIKWSAVDWSNYGLALQNRFMETDNSVLLDSAIIAHEKALSQSDTNHPDIVAFLNNLSDALRIRSKLNESSPKSSKDLDRAINLIDEALQTASPYRTILLFSKSNALFCRYGEDGEELDLQKALEAMDKVLADSSESTPADRALFNNTMSCILLSYHRITGSPTHIDKAVEAGHTATICDPNNCVFWNSYGNALSTRFEYSNSSSDINAAILALQEATRLETFKRGAYHNNLGDALRARFERTGCRIDLENAISAGREAVKLCPPGNKFVLGMRMNNLGNALQRRSEWRTDITREERLEDISEAVSIKFRAKECFAKEHMYLPTVLNGYGSALSSRSDLQTVGSDIDRDLQEAIDAIQEAVSSSQSSQPSHALFLITQGNALRKKLQRAPDSEVPSIFVRTVAAYEEALFLDSAPPSQRLEAGHLGAQLLFKNDTVKAAQFLRKAVELLPLCSPRSIGRSDQQFMLSSFSGLASNAAAVMLEAGFKTQEVLLLLELGRGVMASLILQSRSDITDLEADPHHREIAAKFVKLRDLVDDLNFSDHVAEASLKKSTKTIELQLDRRTTIVNEFNDTLKAIRSLDGFSRFLKGPSPEAMMKTALETGPIVVLNIANHRSDAFLVTEEDIRPLTLEGLSAAEVQEKVQSLQNLLEQDSWETRVTTKDKFGKLLEWLWNAGIQKIMQELNLLGPKKDYDNTPLPHITWVPGGLFNAFPIHAAGYHGKRAAKGNVVDYAISSYAPTIKSLEYVREKNQALTHNFDKRAALLVSMPETPEREPLPFVQDETIAVKQLLEAQGVENVVHSTPPLKNEILNLLGRCNIVHFACHGESTVDPSQSCLLLHDWKAESLTVKDITAKKVQNAQLAYLSVCHSVRNRAFPLLDEGIHLAGSFMLAGFPHVVGTLWQINDKRSVAVAEAFYSRILSDDGKIDFDASAEALHRATRILRDETTRLEGTKKLFAPDPFLWAPYVHLGVGRRRQLAVT